MCREQSSIITVALVALSFAIGLSGCGDNDNDPQAAGDGARVVFSAPVPLRAEATSGFVPRLAADEDGAWLLVWVRDQRIVASRSTDGGRTWDMPSSVDGVLDPSSELGSSYPALASDGPGAWVVVWQQHDRAADESDVLAARSGDGGRTWTPAQVLSAAGVTDAGERPPHLATDGAGTWMAVWESRDGFGDRFRVTAAVSRDDGVTWGAPFEPIPSSYWQFHPRVAADANGRWVLTWGTNDPLVNPLQRGTGLLSASSTDVTRHWTTPVAIAGPWAASNAQDVDVQLVTDGGGTWLAVWTSERFDPPDGLHLEIATARSTDGGASWSLPISVDAPGVSSSVEVHPRVAIDRGGRVVVAWTSSPTTNRYALMLAQSADFGRTWSAPIVAPDGDVEFLVSYPPSVDLATDGLGAWRLVWPRATAFSGGLPTDYDLVLAAGAVAAD